MSENPGLNNAEMDKRIEAIAARNGRNSPVTIRKDPDMASSYRPDQKRVDAILGVLERSRGAVVVSYLAQILEADLTGVRGTVRWMVTQDPPLLIEAGTRNQAAGRPATLYDLPGRDSSFESDVMRFTAEHPKQKGEAWAIYCRRLVQEEGLTPEQVADGTGLTLENVQRWSAQAELSVVEEHGDAIVQPEPEPEPVAPAADPEGAWVDGPLRGPGVAPAEPERKHEHSRTRGEIHDLEQQLDLVVRERDELSEQVLELSEELLALRARSEQLGRALEAERGTLPADNERSVEQQEYLDQLMAVIKAEAPSHVYDRIERLIGLPGAA